MGPLRTSGGGTDSYANFTGLQHLQDRNDIVASASGAAGTILLNITGNNGAYNQGQGAANPFVAGTAASIITTGIFYPYLKNAGFAAAGLFTAVTKADGSASLAQGAGLSPGDYYVQVRLTAPNGTLADYRYLAHLTS